MPLFHLLLPVMTKISYDFCGVGLNGHFIQFLCLGKNQIEVVQL